MADFVRVHTGQSNVLRRRSFNRLLCWDADLPSDLVQRLWEDPQSLLRSGQTLQEKLRCLVVRIDHRAGQFVLKHHSWGGVGRTLKKSLRRSSAQKAFFDTRYLCAAGVRTPRAWAFGERRFGPLSSHSFLLTEYVEGTTLYRQMRFDPPPTEVVHDLARQVADLWQQLDDLSVSHNDFKTENLLIHPDGQLWLIDLELMRRCRHRKKLRQKQRCDAADFLHPRNWRTQPALAEIFQQRILQTPAATAAVAGASSTTHPLLRPAVPVNGASQLVTVLIPCHRDAQGIGPCIESVRDIADEILIADVGASDDAKEIARTHPNCRTLHNESHDELAFENWAQQQARHPWILRILPHERLNSALGRQIQDQLASEPTEDGFRIPRRFLRQGQVLRFGVFRTDAPIRLYRKAVGRIELCDGQFEVAVEPQKVGSLSSMLTCEMFDEFDREIINLLGLTSRRAAAANGKGWQANRRTAVFGAAWQFLRSYLLNFGAADGWAGLKASWLSAAAIFLREAKLWELQRSPVGEAKAAERSPALKIFLPEQSQADDASAGQLPPASGVQAIAREKQPSRSAA
jgi:(heptosyl)LPS beta-1,4-glucosyltransferase